MNLCLQNKALCLLNIMHWSETKRNVHVQPNQVFLECEACRKDAESKLEQQQKEICEEKRGTERRLYDLKYIQLESKNW